MEQSYTIKIKQFEGPFDLLLFFIERDEIDIYDIPISKITDDFLSYIRELEELNLDVASEFILVAATLMRIKARMLIPRKQMDEEGNEIDPREELVQKLIEYKRYKSVMEEMRGLEEARRMRHVKGNAGQELAKIASKALVDLELESLTLFNLMKAFQRVLERLEDRKNRTEHTIIVYKYTVAQQQDYIRSRLPIGQRSTFESVFAELDDRMHAIITFLALLELLNAYKIKVVDEGEINSFWLTRVVEDEGKSKAGEDEDSEATEDTTTDVAVDTESGDADVKQIDESDIEVGDPDQNAHNDLDDNPQNEENLNSAPPNASHQEEE